MPKQESVDFLIWLTEGTSWQKAKGEVEHLFNGKLKVVTVMEFKHSKTFVIACKTNQQTYEEVFETKLSYEEKIKRNSLEERKFYMWSEDKSAKVPKKLEDLVKSVTLQLIFISC